MTLAQLLKTELQETSMSLSCTVPMFCDFLSDRQNNYFLDPAKQMRIRTDPQTHDPGLHHQI